MIKIKYFFLFNLLILFFYLGLSQSYSQLVDQIDPPFWWTGMKNNELQIMIHGKQISQYEIVVDKENYLASIETVDNQNYVFLNLLIPNNGVSTLLKINLKKGGEIIETINYELKKRNKTKVQHQGFNNSDVIYLIMPDRFSNGDTLNDNFEGMIEKADRTIPDGRHGGDIQGIINHLDYIKELGVTTLWINPLLENNMETFSYHGYSITDHYRIDPRHGTNDLYAELVNKCHQKDLKIMLDVVLNHCGSNHWWMADLPSENWLNYPHEYTQTNYRASTLTDPYASKRDRDLTQNGWFTRTMPDLNQDNSFVAKYLIQNSIWWVELTGLDGIRLDTQPYASNIMVAEWAKQIMNEYPEFTILGEAWMQKIPTTAYWQENSRNFDGYSSSIPVITDFPLYYAITEAFYEQQTWTEGMAKLYYVLSQDFVYENAMNTIVFLDNHDVSRIFSTFNKDINKLKLAVAFQLTTRGIPSIYTGTEILMEGYEHDGHGIMRADFPGGWKEDENNAFIKEGRSDLQNEMYDYIQNILTWRKDKKLIHTGQLTHFIPENNIYVYFRHNDEDCVMVILNNNESEQFVDTGRFTEISSNYTSGFDIITKSEIKNLNKIKIGKKTAMIIELKK